MDFTLENITVIHIPTLNLRPDYTVPNPRNRAYCGERSRMMGRNLSSSPCAINALRLIRDRCELWQAF